jgi:hypothetical protein
LTKRFGSVTVTDPTYARSLIYLVLQKALRLA